MSGTLHSKLGQFGSVPLIFFRDKRVSGKCNCLKVYLGIQSFQGVGDEAFPSIAKIADRVDLAEGAATRALHILEESGWIKITRRPGHSSLYDCLTYSEPADEFATKDRRTDNGDALRFEGTKNIEGVQKDCTTTPLKNIEVQSPKNIGPIKAPLRNPIEKPSSDSDRVTINTRAHSDHYYRKYAEKRSGAKPRWGPAQVKTMQGDIERVGDNRLHRLINLFFDAPPPTVKKFIEMAGMEYGVFHSQIDKLLASDEKHTESIPEPVMLRDLMADHERRKNAGPPTPEEVDPQQALI